MKLVQIVGEYSVESIFDIIRMINKSKSQVYAYGELYPYVFEMAEPAAAEEIDRLQTEIQADLPADFIQYLKITNGLKFALEAETRLCDIQEILEFKEDIPYPENIIVFGTAYGTTHFVMDLNQTQGNCIFITDPIGHDFAYSLNCSFTDFLNRYISCYGVDFWNWGVDYENKIPTEEI